MFSKTCCAALFCLVLAAPAAISQTKPEAQTQAPAVALPAPQQKGAMSLEEALSRRRSTREFAPTALTDKELGQLLWAAQGITSPDGKRTAPSAMARYPLEIYVATAKGLFHYEPKGHALERVTERDLRKELASQPAVQNAPAVFIVTAEFARLGRAGERAKQYAYIEAGHAAQNLLLQAVALGLAGVPVGGFNDEQLRKALPVPEQHEPLYLLPVGHPK